MNTQIFVLTLRQLLGKRRTLALVAFATLPLLIAVVFRTSESDMDPAVWAADHLLKGFIVTTLLPLVALVFSTTALGMEIEDGTIVYLLSKPLRRAQVVIAKLAASWLPAAGLVSLSTAFSAGIALQGSGEGAIVLGFVVAVVLGALVYSSLFLLLSLVTSRALIGGLIYVFLWEGIVTELFSGTRVLSVRQYTLGVADLISDTAKFDANLGGVNALVLMAVAGLAAAALAVRRLNKFEMRGLF